MKKFVKVLSIVVNVLETVHYGLLDILDDGKLNGSASRSDV